MLAAPRTGSQNAVNGCRPAAASGHRDGGSQWPRGNEGGGSRVREEVGPAVCKLGSKRASGKAWARKCRR